MTKNLTLPLGLYVKYKHASNLIFFSGILSFSKKNVLLRGKVSENCLKLAIKAAKFCGANLLREITTMCNIENTSVKSILKLNVYINSNSEFMQHSHIADEISKVILIKYPNMLHARTTIGVSSLPLNAMIETEAIIEI